MNEKTTEPGMDRVMVMKADIPLLDEESTGEFTEKLDRALTEHFRGLKLDKKPRYLYVSEIYADRVVANVNWINVDRDELSAPSTYYRLDYKRGTGGAFTFGAVEEVDRKTTWMPRAKVSKRLDDDFWKGAV